MILWRPVMVQSDPGWGNWSQTFYLRGIFTVKWFNDTMLLKKNPHL